MDALDALRRAPEVEVDAPEGSTEGVGEAGCALVVEGVGFAEDEGEGVVGKEGADIGLSRDGGDGGGVVHQGALQRHAGLGRAADVVVRGDEGDVVVHR